MRRPVKRTREELELHEFDPADPTPNAAYVGKVPELDIDERIRAVARGIGAVDPDPIDPAELMELDIMANDEEMMTPAQMDAMRDLQAEELPDDIPAFINALSTEQRQQMVETINALDGELGTPQGAEPGGSEAPEA